MPKTPIPERLRIVRKRADLSQSKLGEAAGIDPGSVSARMNQYERDIHVPDYQTMKRIAAVLDLPVPFFYTEDDTFAEIIHYLGKLDRSGRDGLLQELKKRLPQVAPIYPALIRQADEP